MKAILITTICLLTGNLVFAQFTKITTSGTIEFEKSINLYKLAKDQMDPKADAMQVTMYENYRKNTPQFRRLKATLQFNGDKSLYTPAYYETYDRIFNNDNPGGKEFNTVYSDLTAGFSTVQKAVYDDTYLLKDSIRKINWKITDETRDIAGYTCRRANALIMDSIYVVAYYTNEIHVSAGPETFTGLPGMILGVALPHEGITWFATKVTDTSLPPTAITIPKKGKVVNKKQLSDILWDSMKNWSAVGNRARYEMMIFLM